MHPSKKAQRLEEIKKLRLFDDILMNQVFQNKTCAEFLLRTILNKESLVVTDVHTQESFNNLHGRGVRLDIFAYDKSNQYNVEVQRANEGASPLRARYNSSLLDANALEKGKALKSFPTFTSSSLPKMVRIAKEKQCGLLGVCGTMAKNSVTTPISYTSMVSIEEKMLLVT